MELDQLYKTTNKPAQDRLDLLKSNMDLVESRHDVYLEWVSLNNLLGDHEKALDLIMNRRFHPWEGGEGKVPLQFKNNQFL